MLLLIQFKAIKQKLFLGFAGNPDDSAFFMLLVFSFIGIPLIPLAFAAILLAFMFGFIGVSALLGNFVLTKIFRRHKKSLLGKLCWV